VNGRDGTGRGMREGKGKGERGKGSKGATTPNFNSWRYHC